MESQATKALRLQLWLMRNLTLALQLTPSLVLTRKLKTRSSEKIKLRLKVKVVVSRETTLSSMVKKPLLRDKDLTIFPKSSLKTKVVTRCPTSMISALRSTKQLWREIPSSERILKDSWANLVLPLSTKALTMEAPHLKPTSSIHSLVTESIYTI
jgi:hypothetical protein